MSVFVPARMAASRRAVSKVRGRLPVDSVRTMHKLPRNAVAPAAHGHPSRTVPDSAKTVDLPTRRRRVAIYRHVDRELSADATARGLRGHALQLPPYCQTTSAADWVSLLSKPSQLVGIPHGVDRHDLIPLDRSRQHRIQVAVAEDQHRMCACRTGQVRDRPCGESCGA